MRITALTIIAMLTYLGVEPVEGSEDDNLGLLNEALGEYNLTIEQFLTPETAFNIGYSRGLQATSFSEELAPIGEDDKPNDDYLSIIEEGYAWALEARDGSSPPPASVVYEAWKAGKLEPGKFQIWASSLDLKDTYRLAVAITGGSGKNSVVIPAGTPIELLGETVKDGVKAHIVMYDGAAVLIPAPDDSPAPLVSGDTAVTAVKKTRKTRTKKSSTKAKTERGPTLRDAFLFVVQGEDGGPGPLQTNGAFAARVRKKCQDLGIGDKAGTFIQKADKHVPYYLNCYKPAVDKQSGEVTGPGRQGVMKPLAWVVAAIQGRKYYLRADGDHDTKIKAIPEAIRNRLSDREAIISVPEPKAT